ncbi:hypothetical protein [Natronorubrum sp. DTA7]|uniref:hypothetical protein n=1 Tax=Natronorubrum sp. DTA7 TaxID=3447016 RepID=UPI003F8241B9
MRPIGHKMNVEKDVCEPPLESACTDGQPADGERTVVQPRKTAITRTPGWSIGRSDDGAEREEDA